MPRGLSPEHRKAGAPERLPRGNLPRLTRAHVMPQNGQAVTHSVAIGDKMVRCGLWAGHESELDSGLRQSTLPALAPCRRGRLGHNRVRPHDTGGPVSHNRVSVATPSAPFTSARLSGGQQQHQAHQQGRQNRQRSHQWSPD